MQRKIVVWLTFIVGVVGGIMGHAVVQNIQSACGLA